MKENSIADWTRAAQALSPQGLAYIDGAYVEAASRARFDSVNPATGKVIASVARCDAADVDRAVAGARRAFDSGSWSRRSPRERKAVLARLSQLILEHREEFALLDSLDMGKSARDAFAIDVPGAAGVLNWYAEAADKLYDEVAPVGPAAQAVVTREPVGVVGAVVPWNFPLDMAAWKLGPSLVAGNSVVLKPAEQSPLSAIRLAALAVEAGLPPGVLQVVPGLGEEAGQALGRHPDVASLAFTGSTEVGKLFQRYAGESNMKMVWLECGGKSANLVFEDCEDLELAAQKAAFGFCFNQGEVCSANTRLLVQRSILDRFLERLVAALGAWQPGDPLDPTSGTGALVSREHTDRVLQYIATGRREGGKILAGGEQRTFNGSGCFVTPTVFAGLGPDSTLVREEIFGPVAVVMPFDDEAQAVALANASPYALAASVWTGNLKRSHRVARALRAGTVSVNTVDALDPCVPFGGFGLSGYGRDLSLHAIDKFTQLKTTWTDLSN
jgi:4-(gamma-glutamylamino)butanal dehydrogenase